MIHRLSLLFFFVSFYFIVIPVKAQDFSNKGKDFWLAYPGHIDGNTSRMALYISSTINTTGVVELPGGATISFTVTANQATVVQISPATYNVINPQSEGILAAKGIHITSMQPVVVYAHILNQARSGSTLVLPTNTLGREYIATSYKSMVNSNSPNGTTNGSNAGSQFTIVGVEDNTTIEITPSVADAGGVRTAGSVFTIVLNKGDVYQYRSTFNNDITGTKIRTLSSSSSSCKPIAVFCGSSWTSLDCNNASGGDNLFLQLMPKSAWGKSYLTAPFADRQYDIFRIIVSDPTTVVTHNGSVLNTATLQNGTYYQFTSSAANVITADKPVMVIQYMISQTCDTRNNGSTGANAPYPGDPEMIIINPIEQTLNDVTVVSARANLTPPNTNITKHFFTIIMKTNALSSLRIDGLPANGNVTSIGTSGYSYIHENVTASTAVNPSHRITADSGFIALAYGMGTVESYGYNAGTNIIDLYQYISLQNQYATVNFPATCVGTPFRFSITLPYQAVKIKWDFNNAANLSPNSTVQIDPPVGSSVVPADSSFVRDGKTLYVYKLPTDYNFTAPGTYPIKVLVNNPTPDGCSGDQEISYDVLVYPKPVVDWTVTSNGCLTEAAQFNDATNAGGRTVYNWLWEFGDATTSGIKNPTKTYAAPGTYNVKLTTITDIGCIADNTKPFTITAAPIAAFKVDSPRCEGALITFSDLSTLASGTITKWYWDFGNGNAITNTTNAAVTQTYAAAGTYNVTLQVESSTGCKSTITTFPLAVSQFPVVDFIVPNVVCLPIGAATFTNQSTIPDGTGNQFAYEWTFGDGGSSTVKDPTHNYAATGPFNVKLKVTSNAGCIKELTKPINTIYARPTATFTIPSEICLRDTIRFTSSSSAQGQTVTAWNWNFGNGSSGHAPDTQYVYTVADTFDVSLFVYSDKGCISDTMVKQVIVNPLPAALFSVSSPVCETKDITFTSQSQANVGTLTNWHWNFGDGNTSDLNNGNSFAHVFAAAGSYQVKLAVESSKGCKSDTIPQAIIVHHQPKANFILPEVCLNDSYAQFLDSSYIGDNSESSFVYAWKFGDANATGANPNTSTLKNPTHQYTALGNYTAQVKVTSLYGCVDSIARTFTVNGSFPVADFDVLNPTSLCSNRDVVIQNKSTVTPGNITKVEIYWDYLNNPAVKETDDVPFFDKTYSHLYADFQQPLTKTFRVRFVAYSGGSCTGEFFQDIPVNASPKTQFITIPGICFDAAPRQVTQASETGGVPKAQDVFSSATPGISSTGLFDPSVSGAGTYTLQYLYISTAGCRDSSTNTITVWPSPTAKFGISDPACEKAALTFTDSSVANFGNISTWNWNFGDGNIVPRNSAAPFTHTYNTPNTYIVSLSVTTDSGCTSLLKTQNLQVNDLPVVNFTIPSICLPDGRGTFTDQSTIADGTESLFSYLWNFGDPADPNPSTLKNPMHRYSAVGPYDVKLKVTSSKGCIDSFTQTIGTIYPQPKANFSVNPFEVCLGDTFSFTDQSQPTGSNAEVINEWHWNFGDGSSPSLIKDPQYKYLDDSTYTVSLYVFNNRGCVSDTVEKSVTVHPYPVVNAGPDVFVLSDGFIVLNPTVSGSNLSYQWTPALYLDNASIKNPKFTPGVDQAYRLTVTGIGGCSAFDDVFVKVLKSPVIPNAFSPNKDGINDTWNIQYLDSYPGCTIEVFDRYGRRIFASQGYDHPWNGTINGKEISVGVYYYIINPKNGRKPISGSVTILK
jgi:gliding motility-associated-like protein